MPAMRSSFLRAVTPAFLAALAFFVVSRLVLHFGLAPFFEGDTYKYLGGADALWAGQPLPQLFQDLARVGGGLHAVPGYCLFLDLVWMLCGVINLRAVLVAQSLLALTGYLAGAALVRRWLGGAAGLVFFVVLVTAPTLAWLEHLLMPDILAIPLFLVPAWAVVVAPRDGTAWRFTASGLLAGSSMAAEVLIRAANNLYVPVLLALAIVCCQSRKQLATWAAGFALAFVAGVFPWLLHNHREHGVWRLTQSTGRHVYFSALWSGSIDRAEKAAQVRLEGPGMQKQSQEIADRVFQRLLAGGRTIPDADSEMGREAIAAYRSLSYSTILAQRGAVILSLFVPSSETVERLAPLRASTDRVLQNSFYEAGWRDWTEGRLGHVYSRELVEAQARARADSNPARALVRAWMKTLTLDGAPLLALFLGTLGLVALAPRGRGEAFLVLIAPPAAFLAVFFVLGLPRYRYQVVLHPFLYGSIVVALGTMWERLRLVHGKFSENRGE